MLKVLRRLFLMIMFSPSILYTLPATHAYLSVPKMKKRVEKAWSVEMKKYKSLIDQALEQELIYENTHHVFYHAQKCDFRIVQDFIKKLYTFLYPQTAVNNFYFLRPWYNFAQNIDANDFIDSYEMGVPKDWNDNHSHLSKAMLSVNFSLFGSTKNYGKFGECTFKYFFNNKSIKAPAIENIFDEIFDCFHINKKYIDRLVKLGQTINTPEGSLFQIFVPIEYVDKIAFAAQRLGTPYRNSLLMPDLFDYDKQRYLSLTPMLNIYCHNPEQFGNTLDRLQGRLLFSGDVLLNPCSGVKIFRYTTIDDDIMQSYQKMLTALTDKIFTSWFKHLSKNEKEALSFFGIYPKAA